MKKIRKLMFLSIMIMSLSACGKAKDAVEQGRKQLEAKEYEAAAQTFGEALSDLHWYDSVKEQDILLFRAEAFMGAQEFESALMIYEGLLDKDSGNSDLLQDRGMALYGLQRYEDAEEAFAAAAKNGKPEAAGYAGRAAEAGQNYQKAEEYYEQALSDGSGDASLYVSIGRCRIEAGDLEGALAITEEGIQKADGEILRQLLYQQAVCYEYMQDYETARDKMTRYVEQYPDDEAAKKEYEFLLSR